MITQEELEKLELVIKKAIAEISEYAPNALILCSFPIGDGVTGSRSERRGDHFAALGLAHTYIEHDKAKEIAYTNIDAMKEDKE